MSDPFFHEDDVKDSGTILDPQSRWPEPPESFDIESQTSRSETATVSEGCRHEPGYHQHQTYNAWDELTNLLWKRDKENLEAWIDEVDSLLTFAGLFLTVITLFIGMSSPAMQPDQSAQTVQLLLIIAQQLNGTQVPNAQLLKPPPFERNIWAVAENSLLFASLICCLMSSGMGLWVKEWLREYMLDLPYRPRDLVHVQEYRHHGLTRWHMRGIVACISFMLQLAVAAFSAGISMMTADLDHTLNLVIFGLLGLWTVLTWGTAILPAFSTHCPFKSPLAGLVYQLHRIPAWISSRWQYRPMVAREEYMAREQGTKLEGEALKYVYREYWGDSRLETVKRCFKDMDRSQAVECIEELIAGWYGWDRQTLISKTKESSWARIKPPTDAGALDLLGIWGELHDCRAGDLWGFFVAELGKY